MFTADALLLDLRWGASPKIATGREWNFEGVLGRSFLYLLSLTHVSLLNTVEQHSFKCNSGCTPYELPLERLMKIALGRDRNYIKVLGAPLSWLIF